MEHYYSKKPTSQFRPHYFEANPLGETLKIHSGSGVFSIQKLDKGSELLIKRAVIQPGWKVLDLGCGYGIIGIALARHYKSCIITMADINERAIRLSKKNVKENNLDNVSVICSDGFEKIKGEFDTILLNPPQNAGKDTVLRLFREAKEHLRNEGLLQVVARHSKGGKDLLHHLTDMFGNCTHDEKQSGYRVYVCRKD